MTNETLQISIRDESFPKKPVSEMIMELTSNRLTARDLITERVQAELDKRFEMKTAVQHQHLIDLTVKETLLNTETKRISNNLSKNSSADHQIERALLAFSKNEFLLLVDDTQIDQLDKELELRTDTVITFLRLTPLKGG